MDISRRLVQLKFLQSTPKRCLAKNKADYRPQTVVCLQDQLKLQKINRVGLYVLSSKLTLKYLYFLAPLCLATPLRFRNQLQILSICSVNVTHIASSERGQTGGCVSYQERTTVGSWTRKEKTDACQWEKKGNKKTECKEAHKQSDSMVVEEQKRCVRLQLNSSDERKILRLPLTAETTEFDRSDPRFLLRICRRRKSNLSTGTILTTIELRLCYNGLGYNESLVRPITYCEVWSRPMQWMELDIKHQILHLAKHAITNFYRVSHVQLLNLSNELTEPKNKQLLYYYSLKRHINS